MELVKKLPHEAIFECFGLAKRFSEVIVPLPQRELSREVHDGNAGLAQLVEHLTCNQRVVSSNLTIGSTL